jgi:hypothetical protein
MSKPTPNDYIVYHAHQWRKSDQSVIGADEGGKTAAKQSHRADIRNLRNAVDLAIRNGAPVMQPESGKGEP